MRYFTRIRDNPEASDYMRPKSLHRLDRSPGTIITQRWDKREKKWVDDPNLIAFTGIGGADDFREIDKRTANNLLRSWGIKEIPESAIQRHGKHSGQEGRPGEQGGSQEGFTHNGNGESGDAPKAITRIQEGGWDFSMVGEVFGDKTGLTRSEAMEWLQEEVGLEYGVASSIMIEMDEIGQTEEKHSLYSPTRLTQEAADEFIPRREGEITPIEKPPEGTETFYGVERGSRPPEVVQTLQGIELEISENDFETAFFVNPMTGDVRFEKVGEAHQVLFDDEEAARARDTIMIHNHPSGSPPTAEDYFFALGQESDESHVYHENGRYIMRFNPEMGVLDRARLRDAYFDAKRAIKPLVDRGFTAGEIDSPRAYILLNGGILKNIEREWPSLFDYSAEEF